MPISGPSRNECARKQPPRPTTNRPIFFFLKTTPSLAPDPPNYHPQVRCSASQRGELHDLASIFRGSIVDVSAATVTMEVVGKEDKMKAITGLLEPYGRDRGVQWGYHTDGVRTEGAASRGQH